MEKATYMSIAENSYKFITVGLSSDCYNNIAVECAHVCEMVLKHVIERYDVSACDTDILREHSLIVLSKAVCDLGFNVKVDTVALGDLSRMYPNACYPVRDYIDVTASECAMCLQVTRQLIIQCVNIMFVENRTVDIIKRDYLTRMPFQFGTLVNTFMWSIPTTAVRQVTTVEEWQARVVRLSTSL